MIDVSSLQSALEIVASAKRIHCICHRNPDGDAIGSVLAAGLLLEQQYPDAQVLFHCVDPVPETMRFLPSWGRIRPDMMLEEGDVAVVVDSAEPKLTEYHETHPQLFDGTVPCVNIDHHYSNTKFGAVNFVLNASSACEVLTQFAEAAGWEYDSDIATCLLTGLYTDTGGLLHSNTTAEVYRTVGKLLRHGARQQEVVQSIFRTAKLSTLRLWGRVLEKIHLTDQGGAITAITAADFRATGADYSELTGAIDYVNAVPGMRFSLVLSERGGQVKGSLRTLRDDVDVSAMAGKFSGGGHRKAAGFSLPGKLQPELRWKVVEEE